MLNEKVCDTLVGTMSFNVCSLDHNALNMSIWMRVDICGCASVCVSISLSALFSMMSFVIVCLCICWFGWRAFVVTVLAIFIALHCIASHHDPMTMDIFFFLYLSLHAGFSFVPSHSIISIKCINKHNPLIKSHRKKKSPSSSFYIDSKWLCQRAPSTKGLYTLFVYD